MHHRETGVLRRDRLHHRHARIAALVDDDEHLVRHVDDGAQNLQHDAQVESLIADRHHDADDGSGAHERPP